MAEGAACGVERKDKRGKPCKVEMSAHYRSHAQVTVFSLEICVQVRGSAGWEVPVGLPVAEWSCVGQDWPQAGLAGRVGRGEATQPAGRTSAKTRGTMNIQATLTKGTWFEFQLPPSFVQG